MNENIGLPAFIKEKFREALKELKNPKGMTFGTGKVQIDASYLNALIAHHDNLIRLVDRQESMIYELQQDCTNYQSEVAECLQRCSD